MKVDSRFVEKHKHEKYDTRNPIGQLVIKNFMSAITSLLKPIGESIHTVNECGCGQGHVSRRLQAVLPHAQVRGFDLSTKDIRLAQIQSDSKIIFSQKSIYDLGTSDKADLIVCCEVLEHLQEPELALQKMAALEAQYYLFSVPREPLWKVCQMLAGNHISEWGNTPGYINHWSVKKFEDFIGLYYQPIETLKPFPWQMVLARLK
ncbi:class I SAM-dependent methyltransferase [Marinicella sp. W31]|uniref:class I SAM-dependent methyltransferase n=1 Tax=Marinicella sp. W31 TaxID=3023713 RepID=UPI0037564C6B